MGTEVQVQPTRADDRNTPEYLAQLLKDKKQIQAFPNVFIHLERILDEEITKVRGSLFHFGNVKECLALPEANGQIVTLQEKLFVPMKEHPEFNFVGRILGPRGMTAKQLEQETQCKIMVRGKGSMRDKKKINNKGLTNPISVQEELNRGKPNWEHLSEDLHVLITVEDTRNRAEIKLKKAVEEVKKLLVPAPEGEDDLKKRQLMELAILNGTYRDTKASSTSTASPTGVTQTITQGPRILAPGHLGQLGQMQQMSQMSQMGHMGHMGQMGQMGQMSPSLRSPTPAGAPIIYTGQPQMSRLPTMSANTMSQVSTAALANLSQGIMSMNGIPMSMSSLNGGPPPLVSPTDAGLLYNMSQYAADPYALATSPLLAEYPTGLEQNAGTSAYVR